MTATISVALIAALAITEASVPSGTIAEACSGTETVQIGAQPAKTVPYSLTFSADLKGGSYCYDACGKDQTYPIADPGARPIKLADLDRAGQVRHLTFDPATSTLMDYQVFDAGLGKVTRQALGSCKPAAFHAPWSPPK
jgi:hypothetical protein